MDRGPTSRRPRKCSRFGKPFARSWPRARAAPGRCWRPWSIPHLNVFRATKLGDVEYFCDDELAEQPEPDKWQRGTLVTTPGIPLRLSGTQAEEFQLANHLVENFAQFKQYYGLENDPVLVEPGWADFLIQALASPGVAVLLLVIGGAALYVELHAPGIGIGAFVAAICFLLFFWSRYLGGTAGWLEVFAVPGRRLLPAAGDLRAAWLRHLRPRRRRAGAGLADPGQPDVLLAAERLPVRPARAFAADDPAAGMGLFLVAYFLRKRLPRSPLLGRMMLAPPAGEEAETIRRREALVDFHELVGTAGRPRRSLHPVARPASATCWST